jgi:hypothetical protein
VTLLASAHSILANEPRNVFACSAPSFSRESIIIMTGRVLGILKQLLPGFPDEDMLQYIVSVIEDDSDSSADDIAPMLESQTGDPDVALALAKKVLYVNHSYLPIHVPLERLVVNCRLRNLCRW